VVCRVDLAASVPQWHGCHWSWLYNVTGGGQLVAYVEAVDTRPIYADNFGLTVYQIKNQPSVIFQMIGFTIEIRVVIISGLTYCCDVYIYDSAGNILGSGHANETGAAEVDLANPAVGNATISVACNRYTYNYTQHILLGGDAYEVYFWFERPILAVYTDILDASFTGWLRVHSISCNGSIYYIKIWLVNQTTTSTEISIIQVNSDLIIYPDETSLLEFTPQYNGWASNITVRGELYYSTHCTIQTSFYYNYTSAAIGELRATLNIKSN